MDKEDALEALRKWQSIQYPRITQADIAEAAEVSRATVAKWFSVKEKSSTPRAHQIKKLERYRPGLVKILFEE